MERGRREGKRIGGENREKVKAKKYYTGFTHHP